MRDKIFMKIYGTAYLEFFYIDTFLELFSDGKPKTNLPMPKSIHVWTNDRITKYLTDSGYLNHFGNNGYVITALGQMHLSKGGCRGEFIRHKLNRLSFFLSVFATIVSIISFFVVVSR